MSKMEIWNAVKTPPPSALKGIQAGRLKGKTDISPMWRYEVMTEKFGPVGFGWKYTIDSVEYHEGDNGQRVCQVQISLYVKHAGEWSEAIPGAGGSMLITNEKLGPYTDDDCVKKALTDALGTAMKMLGVAAEVYAGRIDHSSKYTPPPAQQAQSQAPAAPAAFGPGHKHWGTCVAAVASGKTTLEVIDGKYNMDKGTCNLFIVAVEKAKTPAQ